MHLFKTVLRAWHQAASEDCAAHPWQWRLMAVCLTLLIAWMLLLSGCADAMYFPSRTLFQLECDPKRTNGTHCMPIRKGS